MKFLNSFYLFIIAVCTIMIMTDLHKIDKSIKIIAFPPEKQEVKLTYTPVTLEMVNYFISKGYIYHEHPDTKVVDITYRGYAMFHLIQDKDITFMYATTPIEKLRLTTFIEGNLLPQKLAFL